MGPCLNDRHHRVFIGGIDAEDRFVVQAYDARTGALRWQDRLAGAGQVSALAISGGEHDDNDVRLFAVGLVGCNPVTFVDCELAIRAYNPNGRLLWKRADTAAGGDWTYGVVAVADERVFVGAGELLGDGQYHGTVRTYGSDGGAFKRATPFGVGVITGLQVRGGALLAGGNDFRPDGSSDLLVRMYRTR